MCPRPGSARAQAPATASDPPCCGVESSGPEKEEARVWGLGLRLGDRPSATLSNHGKQDRRRRDGCPDRLGPGGGNVAPTCRRFQCARCGNEVLICSHCDRGNRYCSVCSPICRRESQREAGRRYQKTHGGAMNHARRQARYRASMKESDASGFTSSDPGATSEPMTTPADAPAATSPSVEEGGESVPRSRSAAGLPRCSFCGQTCAPVVRTDVIRRRGPQTAWEGKPSW